MVSPPLLDTSPDGLAGAIDADSVGTRVLGGELPLEAHLDPDAAWAVNPIPDPFRSVVAATRFDERSADRRIAEIAAAFAERATPFLWWRAPFHGPADLGQRLERAGIWQVGDAPAMTMDLADLPAALESPAGLEILEVTDVAGLREYLAVLGVEPPPEGAPPLFTPEIVAAIMAHSGTRLVLEPVPLRYVGRIEGRPVATSRLSLAGGAAGIYAVETLAEFRGRGIGRAMTLAPLLAARRLGYRIATLQSSEAGFGVYRSIGFEEQFRYAIHVGGVPPGSIG
ncbi:MAG TPA: GNAT family N-acetyltransferase [Candidatus Limnocylindrales bacterium]|nr:GNAT family N-acetyltransferase [Candidatus Limnocylindrales bacterium]